MSDDRNDHDDVELDGAPAFEIGERVVNRYVIRNDGTYRGATSATRSFSAATSAGELDRHLPAAVLRVRGRLRERGVLVGMKARELVSIDRLPPHVLEAVRRARRAARRTGARAVGPRARRR